MFNIDHNKTLLVVAAHPDDEVLGCGGTVARLIKQGWTAYALILGEGITSRTTPAILAADKPEESLSSLRENTLSACKILGLTDVFFCDYPDNCFDTVPLLQITKSVEKYVKQIKPYLLFTHSIHDLNIDHQRTHQAVLTATRPLSDVPVREIYAFETLSSTEWNYPVQFRPDTFVNIKTTLEQKLAAMAAYTGELREYPHPRSLKGLQQNAEVWGMKTGGGCVEAFETVRRIV